MTEESKLFQLYGCFLYKPKNFTITYNEEVFAITRIKHPARWKWSESAGWRIQL